MSKVVQGENVSKVDKNCEKSETERPSKSCSCDKNDRKSTTSLNLTASNVAEVVSELIEKTSKKGKSIIKIQIEIIIE